MTISHLVQQIASISCRTSASTVQLYPLGTLAGRVLPSSNNQYNASRQCQYHSTQTPSIDGETQHHIISSGDKDNILSNDPSTIKRNFRKRLDETKQASQIGGGAARIEKQHARGSLTARERISLLFDGGSFREIDALVTHRCSEFDMDKNVIPGDGVVVGEYYVCANYYSS